MASIGKRLEAFAQERIKLLQLLELRRAGVPDPSQLMGKEKDEDGFNRQYSSAPALVCDFRIDCFNTPSGGDEFKFSFSDDWVIDDTEISPAKLDWRYEQAPIGFPTPSVSSSSSSITFLIPSGYGTDDNSGLELRRILNLYDRQFSNTGLLRVDVPKTRFRINLLMQVTQMNWTVEDVEVPLMDLIGLRFGTPAFSKLSPREMDVLKVTLPFYYKDARLVDQYDMKIHEPAALPSVYNSDQFKNRR